MILWTSAIRNRSPKIAKFPEFIFTSPSGKITRVKNKSKKLFYTTSSFEINRRLQRTSVNISMSWQPLVTLETSLKLLEPRRSKIWLFYVSSVLFAKITKHNQEFNRISQSESEESKQICLSRKPWISLVKKSFLLSFYFEMIICSYLLLLICLLHVFIIFSLSRYQE